MSNPNTSADLAARPFRFPLRAGAPFGGAAFLAGLGVVVFEYVKPSVIPNRRAVREAAPTYHDCLR